MSELIDRKRFSADMRDFQNRVGIWRDEAEDTETRTRADAALATIIETKLILDKQPTVTASPWHRVEEPPKEYGNYLAVVNGEVMEVTYSDMRDDWKWSTCDAEGFVWIRSEFVTHWMPLPEPPKEEV